MPQPKTERILGIDPGFARTGYAVIERRGIDIRAVTYGCISTASSTPYIERLLELDRRVTSIIRRHHPDRGAMERLFFCKNVKTAIAVGQARGVLLAAIGRHKLPLTEMTPQQIKSFVSGYGKASKQQVQRMVQILLHLSSIPKPDDAADALAIALTAAGTTIQIHS